MKNPGTESCRVVAKGRYCNHWSRAEGLCLTIPFIEPTLVGLFVEGKCPTKVGTLTPLAKLIRCPLLSSFAARIVMYYSYRHHEQRRMSEDRFL
jgi:hypothetical protein